MTHCLKDGDMFIDVLSVAFVAFKFDFTQCFLALRMAMLAEALLYRA